MKNENRTAWHILGAPTPGTVSAFAVALDQGYTVFAGTRPGLYRARHVEPNKPTRWQKLAAAPIEILSLAVSPCYATDATLLAGSNVGLFLSRDEGDHWLALHLPMPNPVILCLACSPNYAADGIILAGTLEDGIYYSDSRGERWSYKGFGLLDAAVYALAISPTFAQDQTIVAGTESALYYSYNGARAWKLLDFPEAATPILSLALSPHFAQDQTIYVGTEGQGLYRSTDLGTSWQTLDLPATCVNTLCLSPNHESLLAATDTGLYASNDGGDAWHCLLNQPDAFSLAVKEDLIMTGLVNQGAWLARAIDLSGAPEKNFDFSKTFDGAPDKSFAWQPFFTLPARSLTGMTLSPRFDSDPTGFLFGPQEGIWRTVDGGHTWSCLNESLPTLDIRSVTLSPHFPQDRTLLATCSQGLLWSEDAGDQWALLTETFFSHVLFSPDGKSAIAAAQDGGIHVARSWQGAWQSVPVPWGKQSHVLAFSIDETLRLMVALLDPTQETVSIWTGKPGRFEEVWTQPASQMPVACFWSPSPATATGSWYASLDQQIWQFQLVPGERAVRSNLLFEVAEEQKVLSLTGEQMQDGIVLFACTGQSIYRTTDAGGWRMLHDFGDERAVALALSPAYSMDTTAFALLLGGAFCRGDFKP